MTDFDLLNLILYRVPDIRTHVDSSNNVRIFLEDKEYIHELHALAILDVFDQPVPLSEALDKLSESSTGAQDWTALMSTIRQLYDTGVLQNETRSKPKLGARKYGYGTLMWHVPLLNDRVRTSRFLAGISEVVSSGDIVVDIGTGTGILAIAAARAGARHVYAIESGSIGETAEAVFEANGLADRITLLRGWSTQISLPERADVLVSEIIGNEPLEENVLVVTKDARKRLLKPEARLVPSKVQIFGLPVTIPRTELVERVLTAETLQNWHSWYGIDFGPLLEVARDVFSEFAINTHLASSWKALSEPILLAGIDLKDNRRSWINNTITVTANASGQLDGLLVYFELEVGPTTRLSTHPAQADRDNSWLSMVRVLGAPLSLQIGDRFDVTYKYSRGKTRVNVSRAWSSTKPAHGLRHERPELAQEFEGEVPQGVLAVQALPENRASSKTPSCA